MNFRVFATATCALMTAGCVPYPIYKTLQPDARAIVQDSDSRPVAGAEVIMIAGSYPNRFETSREIFETSADGLAVFIAKKEWRTELIARHGAEIFYWNWCVRKQGYETFYTAHRNGEAFQTALVVRLVPGKSTPCPDYF